MHTACVNNYMLDLASTSGRQYFSPERITRLEASSNYTNIFFTDRRPLLMARILKKFEEALTPYGFVRVNHSHLVNSKFIDYICNNPGNAMVVMQDATKLRISKRKKKGVFSILNNMN